MAVIADIIILIAAFIGFAVVALYGLEWVRIRHHQNKLHNAIRYPRKHKEVN